MNIKVIRIVVFGLMAWFGFCQNLMAVDNIELSEKSYNVSFQHIVSLGGDITETIYALNAQSLLVGVDSTSYWPKAANSLSKVGYFRALSAEGILSLSPDLIIMSGEAGPPAVIDQLRDVKVSITSVTAEKTPKAVIEKVKSIATAINRVEQGQKLITELESDFLKLENITKRLQTKPRVVFLFSVAKGNLLAAGEKTAADAMISLAGGENIFSEYSGYKPVNSETLIAAAPDILLLTDRVLNSLGGIEAVMNFPGVSLTPAGKNKRIIVMDTLYLLGFGPRTAKAALELTYQFYPELVDKSE